jgi:hypothetical protein
MTMENSETQLILNAINGLGHDIRSSELRLTARLNDVAVVQDEHGERILVIEQQCRSHRAAPAQDSPMINWRKIFAVCGIGGGAVSTPWFVQAIRDWLERG